MEEEKIKPSTAEQLATGVARILSNDPNLRLREVETSENEMARIGEVVLTSKYFTAKQLLELILAAMESSKQLQEYLGILQKKKNISGGIG